MKNKLIAFFLLLLFQLNNHNKWVIYTTLKIPVNGQKMHISVKIEVYTMSSLLYLIITHHRIRYILAMTYLKHQGAYTKWIGYHKL